MLKRAFLAIAAAAALSVAVPVFAQTTTEGTQMPVPSKTGYAPVNGVEVYYQVYGEGSPIVLLHGGFGSIEMFGPVIGMLAEKHQVIGIDMQGHGRTLPFDRPMTHNNIAEDVVGVIKFLGCEKADVLGYSMGGEVALQIALHSPEVIDKLILVSAPYAWAGWHDYNQQGMRSIGAASAEGMKQTPMYQAYAAIAPDPEKNWVKLHTQMGQMVSVDYDYAPELSNGLPMPVMLVVGDWDSVRAAHAVQFFELLGGGKQDGGWDGSGMNSNRLAILPGKTHYTIFSSPELATTALSFFDAK